MSARGGGASAPALPQVNLLPPEVRSARGLAAVKRWLALAVLVAMLVCAGLVGKTFLDQADADDQLAKAEERTAQLQAEQAQYAHVPIIMAALDHAMAARGVGMSTDVVWRPYFDAIAATAPAGIRIETMQVVTQTPMSQPTGAADALATAGISTIAFTAQASSIAELEVWMDALETVPGFSNPWYTESLLGATDEVPMYAVTAAVLVTPDAFSLRYDVARIAAERAAEAEAEAVGGDEDEAGATDGED